MTQQNPSPHSDSESEGLDDREDGRNLRVDRGKKEAIQTAVRLLEKGEPLQSIDQIAEASGISRRTLFRYFGSIDGLVDELFDVYLPQAVPYFSPIPPTGSLEQRVRELLRLRVGFVSRFGHIAQTIERISETVPRARDTRELRDESIQHQTKAWLLPEFFKLPKPIATQILLLTNFASVSEMYKEVGEQAADALAETVMPLMQTS